jgi:hypothetical protein
MKVFSFCIYGTERNYYDGLLENIQIIREYFPDFEIYVYKGICDPGWVFEGCKTIETGKAGLVNTLYRFLPLAEADIGFVRDADSRIYARDRWCITEFLKSSKKYHIVRDHYWHKSRIMGGIFGWKSPCYEKIEIPETDDLFYGFEEMYLSKTIYPLIKCDTLVHTNNHAFHGEHVEVIKIPHTDKYDFIGNVIWNNIPKFEYFIGDLLQQLLFLRGEDQFLLCQFLTDNIELLGIPYSIRSTIIDIAYSSNYYLKNITKCQYWLSQYEFAELSHYSYMNSNYLLNSFQKKIIATFDYNRQPNDNEVVIVYGNYPDWHHALPCTSKIYRHASLFFDTKHDVVEYDSSWEPVDTIYILNLKERSDRFNDTLLALCAVKAPIHRIHHYKAEKDGLPPYVGASKNHVDVMTHFKNSEKNNCLILEDDILFIDNHTFVWDSLNMFFSNQYNYNICFLSLSKMGERIPFDNLLSITKQQCTTSSAYFLKKDTIDNVLEVASEGLEKMIETNDHHTFCIDRYWSKLPDLLFFKTKLVFQRPSFSNLTKTVNFHLD